MRNDLQLATCRAARTWTLIKGVRVHRDDRNVVSCRLESRMSVSMFQCFNVSMSIENRVISRKNKKKRSYWKTGKRDSACCLVGRFQ